MSRPCRPDAPGFNAHRPGTMAWITPLLAVALVALFGQAAALTYVSATPSGSQFPQWDGGNTELEFADLNGDGHVDLISIGDHGSPGIGTAEHGVMVYFTDGAGGWSIHQEGDFGYGGIAAGDVNNDGFMDVGYGMHHDYSSTDFGDQLIEVALGDGTGTSWTPWDDGLATSGEDWGMAATDFADFDNDGDLDLVSNSFGCCNGVHVYRNNGDGTWTQTFARTGGNSTCFVCTGDVNGDGHADFAASYQYGCIFLGDGAGGFTSGDVGLPGMGSTGLTGVALGDIDGDGCQDLAFAMGARPYAYVWRTDHWEPADTGLPTSGSFEAAELCDMNADGLMDLAVMGRGTCTVWLGDGAGNWTAGGGFSAPSANETQAFRAGGDIDHNGHPDVALVQEQGSWPSYRNYLHVYKESSAPAVRSVRTRFPRGHETFYLESVQTVRWLAARVGTSPAAVTLEISYSGASGPWFPIAASVPDNGHCQWTASGPITDNAYLRITLTQAGESVSDVTGPLTLLSSNPAVVMDPTPVTWPGLDPRGARLEAWPQPVTAQAFLRISGAPVAGVSASAMSGGAMSAGAAWTVTILDASGRFVRRVPVVDGVAAWDAADGRGVPVPAGVYLARAWCRDEPTSGVTRLTIVR